jgi:hypothetical protein
MKSAADVLEDDLTSFMSSLDPELNRMSDLSGELRDMVAGMLGLFTQTALSIFVLEYAIREKGLVTSEEMRSALLAAQDVLQRIRARGGVLPAGNA